MNEEILEDKIEPIIQNNKIISLKINTITIPLRKSILFSEFSSKFLDAFNILSKYIDLSDLFSNEEKIEEWTEKELKKFLASISEKQALIIKILSDEKQINRDDLIEKINENGMQIDTKKLAGIVAGLNRRINQLSKEKLFSINRNRYILNMNYRDRIKNILFEGVH